MPMTGAALDLMIPDARWRDLRDPASTAAARRQVAGAGDLRREPAQLMDDPTPPAIDQQRALSFGARAELYDRVRPDYPPQALEYLLADLPTSNRRHRVADVGAGAGKLTALLAAGELDIDAIEPDPGMRAVLATRLPGVRVHAGRGEALPLPDGSVDDSAVATLPDRQRADALAAIRQLMTEHPDLRGRTRVEVTMQLIHLSYHRDG